MSDYSDVTDLFCLRDYGETLVTIKRDGTIEYGDKYTPDDAAKVFWSAIQNHDRIAKLLSEITRLREENEKMKYFLRHNVFAEKQFGVYFVCGEGGDKDRNGMPEQIYVCPAYGSDVIYRYKRMDSSAPQW